MKLLRQKSFGVFPSFFQNYAWSHMFTRIFGNSKFSTKTEIILVFVQTNKFWKFKWFLRKVTIHLENLKKKIWSKKKTKKTKKHHKVTKKLSFIWMNNEKSLCILACKQGLPILNACIWNEERPSFIIFSRG